MCSATIDMEKLLTTSSIFLIEYYQKNLSAKKGYKCAYGVTHNTTTCSAYGKKVIKRFGYHTGMKLLFRQFERCRVASGRPSKSMPRGFCTPSMMCAAPLFTHHAASGKMCEGARTNSDDNCCG